jgi:hypothetical protein
LNIYPLFKKEKYTSVSTESYLKSSHYLDFSPWYS